MGISVAQKYVFHTVNYILVSHNVWIDTRLTEGVETDRGGDYALNCN